MPKDTKKFAKKTDLKHFLTNYKTTVFDMKEENDKPAKKIEQKTAATLVKGEDPWAAKREKELTNGIPKLIERSASTETAKMMKIPSYVKVSIETSQRNFSNSMKKQFKDRKCSRDSLIRTLNALVSQFKLEEETLQDNNRRLRQCYTAMIKESDQMLQGHQQKVQALNQLCAEYTKQVEGLISRGAMKPDERPIWFDVYRAFPPTTEPKFARPKPVREPIRPILYPEDEQRAKFHALGHGLGAVNMLSTSGDTHIKRLLRNYEQLKPDGLPEDKLIEQCVTTAESERRLPTPRVTSSTPDPQSVTGQLFAEANIKDIFKDN